MQIKSESSTKGKISFFGGPCDIGVGPDEGLALYDHSQASSKGATGLFLRPVNFQRGLARQLDQNALYCAMRWNYAVTPRNILIRSIVAVTSELGVTVWCRPVDYGPGPQTGRMIDVSFGALWALGVETDDVVTAQLFHP